jgi:16S rRNA processing protein RimM
MDQINKDDCVEVGYIQKAHGLKGEVILVFDNEFEETIEEVDFLFVEIDGGLVPFFITEEGIRFRADDSAICGFELVDTQNNAKDMVGCKVFVFSHEVIESENPEVESTLIGMKVFDAKFGEIGLINRVDDFSGNLVITVNHPRAEVMIPLSDEIITSIDDGKREMFLSCPNGLIEIYLE